MLGVSDDAHVRARAAAISGIDLRFGQQRGKGGELAHGGEQVIDLSLLHGLAQQALHGIGAQEPGGLGLLGQLIGQGDGDVGHG